MRHLLALLFVGTVVLGTAGTAGSQVLIDFGSSAGTTSGAPRSWNNIHSGNMSQTTRLVDASGFSSGIDLVFAASKHFQGSGGAGTSTPTANSPLANLGYPVTVISDYLWSSSSRPLVEFTLQNLDPKAVYDFTIFASRMFTSDNRTTEYAFQGASRSVTTLDAALNTSKIATVIGVAPDANARITVVIKAASTNTNTSGYFYLNALGITKRGGSPTPPMLAFFPRQLVLSRVAGRPACTLQLAVATNLSNSPTIGLKAVDNSTNLPPTWLTLPATATGGQPFRVSFGNAALKVGTYQATLTATTSGYSPVTAPVTLTVRPAGGPLNLLHYGNSFSMGNSTVPDLVRLIAQDHGVPTPNVVTRMAGGTDLNYHLTNVSHAGAITSALPPGEEWDYVIMQGHSVEATRTLGNPATFIANAKAILKNVRAHSPGARAIMFQTWARAQGHTFYTGTPPVFSDPLEMHRQIESSYAQAVVDLDLAFGPDSARRAAAGEAAALFNFAPAIYAGDLYHAGTPITLMSAMSIFTAIYAKTISTFVPNFGGSTGLVQRLTSWSMADDDWRKYAGIADRVAARSLRSYPGSGEDLLLETSVGGPLTAVATKDLTAGKIFKLQLSSPIGTCRGTPAIVVMTWFPTGYPPKPPAGFPEVHLHPAQYLMVTTVSSLGRLTWQLPVPATAAGWSIGFQGAALVPSGKTGNPHFTATDGHEIRMK